MGIPGSFWCRNLAESYCAVDIEGGTNKLFSILMILLGSIYRM